jgi:hypothetical protein
MNPDNSIFSIDVEEHLKKAASHTFGSSAHYPVELVRAALRRGANHIDIHVATNTIRVQDDGTGLDTPSIETLVCLMDPTQPAEVKEAAVEELQNREGIGLLAVFASNPDEIFIENVSNAGKTLIHYRNKRYNKTNTCSLAAGTRITISGSHRDHNREKQLLEAFCRSVPVEIRLNRHLIGNQPLLSYQIAAMKINSFTTSSLTIFGGQIGVPINGTNCHIRLLDRAIPYHHITLPPQQGLIFDAAVETTGEVAKEMIDHLCLHAQRLYNWLCDRYASTSLEHRERIEELVFTHTRITKQETFLNKISPFQIFNTVEPGQALNLSQVRQKAAAGSLYAVPRKKEWARNRYRFRFHTGSKTVLLLPREQADLLINHLSIPITFLEPKARRQNPFPVIRYRIRKAIERFILSLLPVPGKELDPGQLTKPEQMLVMGLSKYFPGYKINIVDSKGPFASVHIKRKRNSKDKEDMKEDILLIRRKHPLVQKALKAVQVDPRHIEIIVSSIVPGKNIY